jgi:putative PIN family toxin of toxin-antitoxin system
MRVVLDVNVWISALLWAGVPRQVVDKAASEEITIFASEPLFAELAATIGRAKFEAKILSLGRTTEDLINLVASFLQWCQPIIVDVPQLRDPKDLIIIATAVGADAEVLVTGDRDLLILNEFEGIPILTPQQFLERYFPGE